MNYYSNDAGMGFLWFGDDWKAKLANFLSNQHGQTLAFWKEAIPDMQREYEKMVLAGGPVYDASDPSTLPIIDRIAAATGFTAEVVKQYLDMLQAAAREGEIDTKYYAPRPGIFTEIGEAAQGIGKGAESIGNRLIILAAIGLTAYLATPYIFRSTRRATR